MKWLDPEIYLSDNYVVLDWETTNYDKGDAKNRSNRIVLGSYGRWREGEWQVYSIYAGEYDQEEVIRACEEAEFIVAQNAKFELGWLERAGLDIGEVLVWDTMIGQYVLNGNKRKSLDLNSIAKEYGIGTKNNLVSILIKGGICPSDIPKEWLIKYCEKDVDLTHEVFLRQRDKIKEKGLLPCMFTRCIFTPVITDMEFRGMYLDAERVHSRLEEAKIALAKVEQELEKIVPGVNWGSPPQKAHALYGELGFSELRDRKGNFIRNKKSKQFPDGAPLTDKDTVLALKATTRKQRQLQEVFAEQSRLSKQITTYLTKFEEACDNNGGHIYGKFNQTVTQTHRLSSSGPNFQNFDRTLKPVFTSRHEGWSIGEIDEAQLEFRVAAFLGSDIEARKDIIEGFDVHSFSASIIGCSRQEAKAHTFKPLFGGTSGTKKEKKYYEAFREKYRAITDTQDNWVKEALDTKEQTIASGLVFYWPYLRVTGSGYVEGNTNVRNYPIQSLATADIVPVAVAYLWHDMRKHKMQSFLVNTIHDSAIAEVHPDERELFEELAVKAFTVSVIDYLRIVYNIEFNVPLEADIKYGEHWGE